MTKPASKRVRLDMRYPKDLLLWAQKFARRKRVSRTQVFIDAMLTFKETHDAGTEAAFAQRSER